MTLVLFIAKDLDLYLSIMGCFFGMTNVMIMPQLCHLMLVSETPFQKCTNYMIISFAIVLLFLVPPTIIKQEIESGDKVDL